MLCRPNLLLCGMTVLTGVTLQAAAAVPPPAALDVLPVLPGTIGATPGTGIAAARGRAGGDRGLPVVDIQPVVLTGRRGADPLLALAVLHLLVRRRHKRVFPTLRRRTRRPNRIVRGLLRITILRRVLELQHEPRVEGAPLLLNLGLRILVTRFEIIVNGRRAPLIVGNRRTKSNSLRYPQAIHHMTNETRPIEVTDGHHTDPTHQQAGAPMGLRGEGLLRVRSLLLLLGLLRAIRVTIGIAEVDRRRVLSQPERCEALQEIDMHRGNFTPRLGHPLLREIQESPRPRIRNDVLIDILHNHRAQEPQGPRSILFALLLLLLLLLTRLLSAGHHLNQLIGGQTRLRLIVLTQL